MYKKRGDKKSTDVINPSHLVFIIAISVSISNFLALILQVWTVCELSWNTSSKSRGESERIDPTNTETALQVHHMAQRRQKRWASSGLPSGRDLVFGLKYHKLHAVNDKCQLGVENDEW